MATVQQTINIPTWSGTKADLVQLAEKISNELSEVRTKALAEAQVIEAAIDKSPLEVQRLIELLAEDRHAAAVSGWSPEVQVMTNDKTTRTGSANEVINDPAVAEGDIREVSMKARASGDSPQITIRCDKETGLELTVIGNDRNVVAGQLGNLQAEIRNISSAGPTYMQTVRFNFTFYFPVAICGSGLWIIWRLLRYAYFSILSSGHFSLAEVSNTITGNSTITIDSLNWLLKFSLIVAGGLMFYGVISIAKTLTRSATRAWFPAFEVIRPHGSWHGTAVITKAGISVILPIILAVIANFLTDFIKS